MPPVAPRGRHRRCTARPSRETEGGTGWVHPRSPSKPGATRPPSPPAPGDLRHGPALMCPAGRRERTTKATHPRRLRLPPAFPSAGGVSPRRREAGRAISRLRPLWSRLETGAIPLHGPPPGRPLRSAYRPGRCGLLLPVTLAAAARAHAGAALRSGPGRRRGGAAAAAVAAAAAASGAVGARRPGEKERSGRPGEAGGPARRAGRRPGPRVRLLSQTGSPSARAPRHHLGSNADTAAAHARNTHGGRAGVGGRKEDPLRPGVQRGRGRAGGGRCAAPRHATHRAKP